jgi:hypothetical protein
VKRTSMAIAMACVLATAARAETNIGISVNIGDAPPPPVVVVREEPHVVYVTDAHVWVVEDRRWDDDCFRVGAFWYSWHSGYWYRARTWRGPFRVIEERYVPVAIHRVPARHWKRHPHGMPPGLASRHDRHRDREVVVVKERGRRRHH